MKPKIFLFTLPSLVLAGAALVHAQTAAKPSTTPKAKPTYGTIFLRTKVGSFKVKRVGDNPSEGKIEMTFKGTVLISGLQGTVVPSGNVRLDYSRPKYNKNVYFGDGKLVIDGKFEGVQFFGRDLDAKYHGAGILFLVGEFDKDLNTGEYWFAEQPQHKYWNTGGLTVTVPAAASTQTAPTKGTLREIGKG